jgi:hypothetical protein
MHGVVIPIAVRLKVVAPDCIGVSGFAEVAGGRDRSSNYFPWFLGH